MFAFIDLASLDLTWRDFVVGAIAGLLMLASVLKAFKEIRTEGWEPARKKFVEWVTFRRTRRRKLDLLIKKVDEIATELRTNGGSSMKDTVNRIDKKVEHIQARVRHQDETSPIAIFELDAGCRLTFTNCAFRELVNADEQDLRKRNYVSRLHPDERTRFLHSLEEAIENKMPIDSTVRFRFDNSHFVQVRMLANPDVRQDGELIGFFGTATKVELGQ